jgi:tripartite-type tricarboxylate transporter receptor subunit TctC
MKRISMVVSLLVWISASSSAIAQAYLSYAKARPKELNFGSTGVGSGIHLITEMFKMQTAVDMVHVPYKDVAQAMPEIIAGGLQVAFNTIPRSF